MQIYPAAEVAGPVVAGVAVVDATAPVATVAVVPDEAGRFPKLKAPPVLADGMPNPEPVQYR